MADCKQNLHKLLILSILWFINDFVFYGSSYELFRLNFDNETQIGLSVLLTTSIKRIITSVLVMPSYLFAFTILHQHQLQHLQVAGMVGCIVM